MDLPSEFDGEQFSFKRLYKADEIISLGKTTGLYDVEDWITDEHYQHYIDISQFIAYGALNNKTNNMIGIIVVGIEEEGRLWIELLGVNKKFRRKGIARNLIDIAFKIGKLMKLRAVFVDVDDDNYSALEFYKKVGFIDSGIISNYYYDKSNAIILRFDL